ncbi:MAG TPA: TPM domain-containing protein [Opitutaceae bacterium]|nr:TPM domain-containing protein [Opitutaceae bacterium]
MKTRHFLKQVEHDRIVSAIAAVERKTSGELRVLIYHKPAENAVAVAEEQFARLKMHHTPHRNAVLLLVSPLSHTFAIYGDKAVHEKCGENFWREVTAAMEAFFRRGEFTDGIIHGIERAGQLLAEHFPRSPDDRNSLPDSVVER